MLAGGTDALFGCEVSVCLFCSEIIHKILSTENEDMQGS